MTHCAACQTPLPLALDQFGPADAPLCRACYFNANGSYIYDDLEDEIRALQNLINKLQADIQAEGYRGWKLQRRMLKDGYSEYAVEEIEAAKERRASLMQDQLALIGRRFELENAVKAAQDAEITRLETYKEST